MENNLQQGWIVIPFTELLDIQGGTQPPKNTFMYEPTKGYIRLLQIRDFGEKPLPTFIQERPQLKTCVEDDILIARYGASIGRIVTGMKGAYNVALAKVVIPKPLNKNFIKYLLKSEIFQRPILSIQRSAQDGFNKEDLAEIEIPLPPLAEQQRIVAKLDAVMQKVESNKQRLEKIPKLLKRFRQSVLAAAVSGDLTQEWRKKNDVTEAWKERRLGDLVDVIGGFAFKSTSFLKEGRNQVFRIGNVKPYDLYFDYSPVFVDDEIANDTARYEAKENDILISMTGTKYKRDYGFAGIMKKSDKKVFVNQRVSNIRCKKEINPFFLLHWLQTDAFRNHFFSGETGNVNQGNVGMDGIREAMIALPSHAEQTEIAETINKLFAFADKLEARYNKAKAMLDKLPQSILAKAFRGELVAQDPNDEPASVLLERIKKEKEKLIAEKKGKKSKGYSIEEKPLKIAAKKRGKI
jgi:type I restriction enzyme S subunit